MKVYTVADLNRGSGLFDHVMRAHASYPSHHNEMPGEVAIGFIAAAIASGLPTREIVKVIRDNFDAYTAEMMEEALLMYIGGDGRIHLWQEAGDGKLKLHSHISWYCRPSWKLDPYAASRMPA